MRGNSSRRRRGITLIWVAVILVFVFGMIGLATDSGYVLLAAHRLQNAADAAALAATSKVKVDQAAAREAAIRTALANSAAAAPVQLRANETNAADGDIVIGRWDRYEGTFTVTIDAPNAVRVTARRTSDAPGGPVAIFFGRIFGVETVEVSRTAVAMMGGGTGAGLIALDSDEPRALEVGGDVTLNVDGGAIQVNSTDDQAVLINGGPTIFAPDLNVCGDVQFNGGGEFLGNLRTGVQPIEDPLSFLPDLAFGSMGDEGTVSIQNGVATLEPGFYSGGITATGGELTLNPGVYVLDGAGLNISGNTNFIADGVMFYVVGSGVVDLTGTGEILVRPPDPAEHSFFEAVTYEGVSIFQERTNTGEARIIGTSMMDLQGTLYFRGARVRLSGTGEGFGTQLVANTVEVSGSGEIHINYDGRFPAPGTRVFLVE